MRPLGTPDSHPFPVRGSRERRSGRGSPSVGPCRTPRCPHLRSGKRPGVVLPATPYTSVSPTCSPGSSQTGLPNHTGKEWSGRGLLSLLPLRGLVPSSPPTGWDCGGWGFVSFGPQTGVWRDRRCETRRLRGTVVRSGRGRASDSSFFFPG